MPTEYAKTLSRNLRRILHENDISAAQMSRDLGISKSTISNWMNGNRIPRGKAMDALCEYLRVDRSDLIDEKVPDRESRIPSRTVKIKVYGRVAAGIPMEMIEDIYDEEEIPADWTRGGKEYFGLVIHGESMQPKMSEGDVVIARRQPDAETGDTVIATVNGFEATCKVLKKYPHGIELVPTNPTFDRMFYTNDEISSLPVTILGKVVELRAKF